MYYKELGNASLIHTLQFQRVQISGFFYCIFCTLTYKVQFFLFCWWYNISACNRSISGVQSTNRPTYTKPFCWNLWSWVSLCRARKTMVSDNEWNKYHISSVWRWLLPGMAMQRITTNLLFHYLYTVGFSVLILNCHWKTLRPVKLP